MALKYFESKQIMLVVFISIYKEIKRLKYLKLNKIIKLINWLK